MEVNRRVPKEYRRQNVAPGSCPYWSLPEWTLWPRLMRMTQNHTPECLKYSSSHLRLGLWFSQSDAVVCQVCPLSGNLPLSCELGCVDPRGSTLVSASGDRPLLLHFELTSWGSLSQGAAATARQHAPSICRRVDIGFPCS